MQQRPGRFGLSIDGKVGAQLFGIVEGPGLGALFHEEIEGIVDRHVGDEVDFDLELCHGLGKDEARQEIAIGVLLHIDEMQGGRDAQ
ncbi:hypothetical protein D3C87_1625490 [compost metagenome]